MAVNDDEDNIHTWLFRELTEREMSNRELARRTGVSSSTVTYWKNGRSVPGTANCRAIAVAFGMDPLEVLVLAKHVDSNDREVQRMREDRKAKEAYEAGRQSDERIRRIVDAA